MKKPVVLLACSKSKVPDARCRVGELYTGQLFLKGKDIATRAGLEFWILSAKYGFVHPETEVDNYDVKFKKPYDGQWPPQDYYGWFLGGQLYFKNAPPRFVPLVPKGQIGEMLRSLTELQNDDEAIKNLVADHWVNQLK